MKLIIDRVSQVLLGPGNYGDPPKDYQQQIDLGNTKNWIRHFHDSYKVFTIEQDFIYPASLIGRVTGEFPKSYLEELDQVTGVYDSLFEKQGHFVRTENVSLKTGKHGTCRYFNTRQVIESIVTCSFNHTPVKNGGAPITIYLLDYLEIEYEYRVFVYKNKITAVSQQTVYPKLNDDKIKSHFELLLNFFNDKVKGFFDRDFTFDFAILKDGSPHFIEPNCFGESYPASAGLFDWQRDHDTIYNVNDNDKVTWKCV